MDDIILFRIGERLTLTAVVVIIGVVVMVGFWRSVQKLDVENAGGIGGSFVFGTPVFVLLAIIGYAWVSLEHPIEVAPSDPPAAAPQVASAAPATGKFVGSTALEPTAADRDFALVQAEQKVRSLNCLARGASLSPRVEDDLVATKLMLLAPVWPEAWGDFDAFARWAEGRSTESPNAEARAAFEREHVAC